MTPFILVSCLSAAGDVNRAVYGATELVLRSQSDKVTLSHTVLNRDLTGRVTHLHSRWASCDSGRRRTSVSSRSLSCRPFWQGSLYRFYQWRPDGSRHLGCVQLPQYGHEDQSRLSLLGGSDSTAGTIKKKGMKLNTTYKPCAALLKKYLHEANGDIKTHQIWTSPCYCEYLWSLFLPELHLSLY